MELNHLLEQMRKLGASDLYFTTDAPPCVKIHGKMQALDNQKLESDAIKTMAQNVMGPDKTKEFEHLLEMNLAIHNELGRFRVSIFKQKSDFAMVIRSIETHIPTLEQYGLPLVFKDIAMEKRGLVLLVGSTGSGKSTTLAALIDHRNEMAADHIITVEDPIEFIHPHKKSLVNQREVGLDTVSYEEALKNTLRQAPDVILIGEIRSRETMEHAIAFAETGHLCLSTLHANNANQALDRIINFFPEERRAQLLLDLSFNLKAIISQRLIPTLDNKRTAAVEIMLGTPLILSLIHRGEFSEIKECMEKSTNLGMQTFDQALEKLYWEKKISLEDALKNADSRNNLRLKIQMNEKSDKPEAPNSNIFLQRMEPEPPKNQGKDKDSGLSLLDDK